jgi:hypothetical protein
MTGAELTAILAALRMGDTQLGALLGVTRMTVWRWRNDVRPIPAPAARWLRQLQLWHERHPPPQGG